MHILGKFLTNADILTDRRGATAIEYALIASLISVAALAAFNNLGGEVENSYVEIDQSLGAALK